MKPLHLLVVMLWLLTITAIAPARVVAQASRPPRAAQPPEAPTPPPAAEPPEAPPVPDVAEPRQSNDDVFDNDQDRVRVGQDFTLREGDTANDVVVIMGNATIDGHARGDVVVILGTVRIGSTAVIDGDYVNVAGGTRVAEGAQVGHDFTVVGGRADVPPDFAPGGEMKTVGMGPFGVRFERFLPWFTRGLLWGRPLVPDLPWMWLLVGLSFFCYLVINQLADGSVAGTASMLMEKPLSAFGSGLLVLLLLGPVCLLLAISVVGLAVIPFVFCAVLIAALIGKVGAIRWMGLQTLRESSAETGLQAMRAFVIGFAILAVAYMIPVIGLATWAIVSVLGLGAATLAFMHAYKREQPVVATVHAAPLTGAPPPLPTFATAPPPAVNVAPPPPVPTPYQPIANPNPSSASNAATAAPAFMPPPVTHLSTAPNAVALLPRALFRERLAALVLDVILVVLVTQLGDLIDSGRAMFLGMLVYHVGFWTWKQTTVGGMICHLRIVRADGAPLAFADALVRGLSAIFSVVVVGLGFLWIMRDPDRQAWHDKVAGTFVVKVPRSAMV
jgi:uncharacterized RDD family membrane protein YckC